MPTISVFYGIIIYLYFFDNQKHHLPHFHARYQGQKAVIAIHDGEVLDGEIPPAKMKLVQAWAGNSPGRFDSRLGVGGQRPATISNRTVALGEKHGIGCTRGATGRLPVGNRVQHGRGAPF